MKKALLSSILLLTSALAVFAYETVIIKFPERELWVKAYYKKSGSEAILQYVPHWQSSNHWKRSIVIHSYKNANYPVSVFLSNNIMKLKRANPTGQYKTVSKNDNDIMVTRCTDNYENIEGQCEFFRVTRGHEGIITIHYMNKDKTDFMESYDLWFNIIKRAKLYSSYYRDERTLNKSEYLEL